MRWPVRRHRPAGRASSSGRVHFRRAWNHAQQHDAGAEGQQRNRRPQGFTGHRHEPQRQQHQHAYEDLEADGQRMVEPSPQDHVADHTSDHREPGALGGEEGDHERRAERCAHGRTEAEDCDHILYAPLAEKLLYRRTRAEMPANLWEIEEAEEEGIQFHFLASPIEVLGRGDTIAALRCQRMQLGEPDESGRRAPVPVPGSEFDLPCDRVILALGQKADLSLLPEDVELHQHAPIEQDGAAPVYPAGDLLTNEGTVTAAIGCGREMALLLHERFSGEHLYQDKPPAESVVRADRVRLHHFAIHRPHGEAVLPVEDRAGSFEEVHRGLDGIEEAHRCLSCGVCNACDRCVTYCPDGVLHREGDRIVFDYDYCKGCGVCVNECSRAVIYMKAG